MHLSLNDKALTPRVREDSSNLSRCTMKLVYAREPVTSSIFLAGPTPRDAGVASWRPEAIKLLEKHEFDGTVFIPEDRSGEAKFNYDDQVYWEWLALETSSAILFWVPRNMENMPAMTTNVEFGMYAMRGRCALGYPKDAPKMPYLRALAERFGVPIFNDLEKLVIEAINIAG